MYGDSRCTVGEAVDLSLFILLHLPFPLSPPLPSPLSMQLAQAHRDHKVELVKVVAAHKRDPGSLQKPLAFEGRPIYLVGSNVMIISCANQRFYWSGVNDHSKPLLGFLPGLS